MRSHTTRILFALAVLALVLAPVAKNFAQGSPQVPSPQAPAPAGAAASAPGPVGSFSRGADPIVLKGEQVPDFAGAREADFRVFASRGGKLEAIPCQMDERNQWGEFVVTKGKRVTPDQDNGAFDDNDEVVFVTRDLGAKADKAQVPGGPKKVYEVEVTDPITSSKGYAYVATYAGNAPAPSSVDYVKYEEQGEGLAKAMNYELGFLKVTSGIDFNHVVVSKQAGGDGLNHMDKLKVRVMQNLRRGFTLGIPTRLDRTEKNFLVKVYGYKDGPVRALRVMKVNLQLIWKLPAPGATVNSVFYPEWIEWPVPINLPFKPTWAFYNIELDVSNDFAFKATDGAKFYSSTNPGRWHEVDGKMTPEETAWNKQDVKGSYFGVVSGESGGFVTVRPPKSFSTTILGLYRDDPELGVEPEYYKGDEKFKDRPEWIKGAMPLAGNRFIDWTGVGRGIHTVYWYVFFPANYKPGAEKAFLNIIDHPIAVTVN
jgi:hypothetical protein